MSHVSRGALIALFLAGLVSAASASEPEYKPGELIVKMKASSGGPHALFAGSRPLAGLRIGYFSAIKPLLRIGSGSDVVKLTLRNETEMKEAIEALRTHPAVEYAEPNYLYYPEEKSWPNDPDLGKCWGMRNTGQAEGFPAGKSGADIQIADVWAQGKTGSREVIVGIMDSGIAWDHPDLAANLYTNPGEIDGNGIDDDHNGYVDDVHGWNFAALNADTRAGLAHGTHVAGIIGAVGNNGTGISGINWQVSLLPIKLFEGYSGASEEAIAASFEYAAKLGVSVLNASFGGSHFSQLIHDAIQEAQKAGILVVTSSGNNAQDNDLIEHYPSDYELPNIIAVAASDNLDGMAAFSNYGKRSVHVAAPGVAIYSTFPNGAYGAKSGTSMAAPFVAGLAALLKSEHRDWDYAKIREALLASCDLLPGFQDKVACGGRINAWKAFQQN